MAKTKKTKKTKTVKLEFPLLVKFHKDAGLNGKIYSTGTEAMLTADEYFSHLGGCCSPVVAK